MTVPLRHSRLCYPAPGDVGGITGTPGGGATKLVGMVIPFQEYEPFDGFASAGELVGLPVGYPCQVSVTAGLQLGGSGFNRTDDVRCETGITLTEGAIAAPSKLIAADSKVFYLTQPRFTTAFNVSGVARGPVAVWAYGRVLDDDVSMTSLTLTIMEPEIGRVGFGGNYPEGAGVVLDAVLLEKEPPSEAEVAKAPGTVTPQGVSRGTVRKR